MLYDLTTVSGQRVKQVDEWQVTGTHWVRTGTLMWIIGGSFAGFIIATILLMFIHSWLVFLVVPVVAAAVVILFSTRRSIQGEKQQNRFAKLRARHKALDGRFANPGNASVYNPFAYECVLQHNHVYYGPAVEEAEREQTK